MLLSVNAMLYDDLQNVYINSSTSLVMCQLTVKTEVQGYDIIFLSLGMNFIHI